MSKGEHDLWYNDISTLFKNINKLWPSRNMEFEEKINVLVRLFIIITFLGYIMLDNSIVYLLTGLFFIIVISIYGYAVKGGFLEYLSNPHREGFSPNMNSKSFENDVKEDYNVLKEQQKIHEKYKTPTPQNPLSNLLLTEIHDNPDRKPAPPAYLNSVEKEIKENTKEMIRQKNPEIKDIDKRLFTEVGDNFTFDRGMRQFYSMPNTQVPNKQKDFVEFCYGSMISCKEGNENACERNAFRHITGY